jgi:hypothetical protein
MQPDTDVSGRIQQCQEVVVTMPLLCTIRTVCMVYFMAESACLHLAPLLPWQVLPWQILKSVPYSKAGSS